VLTETFRGYDAPFHLSEECTNANIAGPRAIVLTGQSGLYLGWAIILVSPTGQVLRMNTNQRLGHCVHRKRHQGGRRRTIWPALRKLVSPSLG
jgi:hypothetical protein